MPLRINVCADRTTIRLGGAVFGVELELAGPAGRVAALGEPLALAVAARVAEALFARMRAADLEMDEETLVFVGVPDAAFASGLCDDEDFGEFVREVAQACLHECERIAYLDPGPRIETGFIESFALERDTAGRERVPQMAPVLEAFPDVPTDTLVLPLVLVTNEALLERASDLLTDGLDFSASENGIAKAIRAALASLDIERVSDPEELGDVLPDDGAGEDEDEAGQGAMPDEDMPFIFMASEQEAAHGERALHEPADLVGMLPALQRLAAQRGAAQFAYSSGVPVVVTADSVYLGFKTVDDLGRRVERTLEEAGNDPDGPEDEAPPDGEQLARRWSRWYLRDYQPRMGAVTEAGFRVAAFPLMAWSEELDRCIGSGESFVPGSGRLGTLEDVFLETSDHDIDDSAEGAYAVCRVIVEDFGDEDGTDPEADGEPAYGEEGVAAEVAVLCGAVRIVAADGTGVSQQNVYSTKQPGRVDFDEYVRQLATFPNLPIRADVQPLFVCDTHLRLMVAVDTEELTDEHDEADDEEEDLPDLRAMRTPRRAH